MYLTCDRFNTPAALFDNEEEAVAYIASWTQRSSRYTTLVKVDVPSGAIIYEVQDFDTNETLGYIREGVLYHPKFVNY